MGSQQLWDAGLGLTISAGPAGPARRCGVKRASQPHQNEVMSVFFTLQLAVPHSGPILGELPLPLMTPL